jgi:hypothetical protein
MNIDKSVVRLVGAGALIGALAVAMPIASSAQVGRTQTSAGATAHLAQTHQFLRSSHTGAHAQMMGASGNRVEMVAPHESKYVPQVLKAPARARTKARRLLNGVNRFCRTRSLADLKARWRAGDDHPAHPTHYFNPRRGASGINPARPRAALVYDGRIGGVMFTGKPLPRLGPIPRAHGHHGMAMGSHRGVEMVHVYCRPNLTVKSMREAFTPNRQLGVMADTIRLRLQIRPAVMDLNRRQLREVRNKIRGYVGEQQQVRPSAQQGGPDPRLRAMRVEIRKSLMKLNEAQLRSVWRLMKSY